MSSEDLKQFSEEYNLPYINKPLTDINVKEEVLNVIDGEIAQKYKILPYEIIISENNEKTLTLFTCNTNILKYKQDLLSLMEDIDSINFFMIEEDYLLEAISTSYNLAFAEEDYSTNNDSLEIINDTEEAEETDNIDKELLNDDSSPIVTLVYTIIKTAVQNKASDIHLEPQESGMLVKFRIDGVLIPQKQYIITEKNKKAIVARIKIMAGLNIAQKKEAQDGNIKLKLNNFEIDFRVSILPLINGEKAVLRILDKQTLLLNLETLGFTDKDITIFNKHINKPTGLILMTGPTGSGKSTTLYSFLNKLDTVQKNITTIENPVEYQLKGINQVNVNERYLSFADSLRSILRQDPDIIMVGEIRDEETAKEVVQAAGTGHLVFSTLHTNDSFSVLNRLKGLNIDPDDITQVLLCVIAQRLVRTICPECQEEYTPDFKKYGTSDDVIKQLEEPTDKEKSQGLKKHVFIHGRGCEHCNGTGYKGRKVAYEFYTMDDAIRKYIEQGTSIYDIKKYLIDTEHMRTMWENGIQLVRNNETTIEEITQKID